MAGLSVEMNRLIRKKCRQEVDRGMTAIAKIGKTMMLEKRKNVVQDWFGEFSYIDMNSATRCVPAKQRISIKQGAVNLASFIDLDAYTDHSKAEAWKQKYGGSGDSSLYVLRLQLYYGIIGLPEHAKARSDSDWVNPKPHVREPLIGVLHRELTSVKFLNDIIIASGLSTRKEG